MVILREAGTLLLASLATGLFIDAAVLDDKISKADAIVIGSTETRTETNQSVSFDLSVTRVIKGKEIPPRLHIIHAWSRRGIIFPTDSPAIDRHIYGAWLLKRTEGDSNWDVLVGNGPDGMMPSLVLPAPEQLPQEYQYSSSASVTEKLVLEIGAGVQEAGAAPEQFLYSLGGLGSPAVDRVFSDFLQSSNISFQAVGISGLLSRNAPGSIATVARIWPSIRSDHAKEYVIDAIRNSFRDTAVESVQQLAALGNEPSSLPDLRPAAISALASIHTREAIPFLASLLSSPDSGERMSAIIGISSFASGCPPQTPANVASMEYIQFKSPSPYRTPQTIAAFAFGPVDSEREDELVAFWTDWWNENRATIIQ